MNWNISFGNARRVALNSLLVGALATGMSVASGAQTARANHNHWVGPAIVGAILGGVVFHHVRKGHHRNQVYGYPVPLRNHARPFVYGYPVGKVYHAGPFGYDYPVGYRRPLFFQDMYRSPY